MSAGRVYTSMDDLFADLDALMRVPPPTRGGTFFYCPWEERTPGSVTSCGVKRYNWATGTRFRTAAAYRRHYRKFHQPAFARGGPVPDGSLLGYYDEAARFTADPGISWPATKAEIDAEALREQVNKGIKRRFGGG